MAIADKWAERHAVMCSHSMSTLYTIRLRTALRY